MAQDIPSSKRTTSALSWANRWDHILARWGVRRGKHRVEPGLYALGSPNPDSPVFVTANYTLSFDALRSALVGIDGYILALDTKGVNVWCAAAEGTFCTWELVERIKEARLQDVVRHRVLILPQLGAAGIVAHDVKKRSGFRVEYGPIRAADLPEYLKGSQASETMRTVRFNLWDRLVLVPVELVYALLPMLGAAVALYLLSGWSGVLAAVGTVLAGTALFPALLPVLPTREFSTKGLILGALVALPFVARALARVQLAWWLRGLGAIGWLLPIAAITGYLALNFTGSTPVASRTGVRREIYRYIPVMAGMLGIGLASNIAYSVIRLLGR